MDNLMRAGRHMKRTSSAERHLRAAERDPDQCWPWPGQISKHGYGRAWVNRKDTFAHRWAWATVNGPIPAGLTLDHLCHTNDPECFAGDRCQHRRCVNPAHLELVPLGVNTARGHRQLLDVCANGHSYAENARFYRGKRFCAACQRAANVRHYRRRSGPRVRHDWGSGVCPRGHSLTDNLRVNPGGTKACRSCEREKSAALRVNRTPEEKSVHQAWERAYRASRPRQPHPPTDR